MNFSKALLIALRTLPKRYVRDGTMACEYGPVPGCVVVIHPELPPIAYFPKNSIKPGFWKRIKFESVPTTIAPVDGSFPPRPAKLLTVKK